MFDTYDKMTTSQRRNFSDVANKLLANNFLARDKKDNRDDYYFVISYKDLFDEYFQVINYELNVDRELGYVELANNTNAPTIKFKKEESIVLLILRVLYHEKMQQTSLNDNVVISVSDIHDKYDYLEMKKKINKTDLINILRMARRYNLIESQGDITNSQTKLVIFPTILCALKTSNIEDVHRHVQKISSDGGNLDEKA